MRTLCGSGVAVAPWPLLVCTAEIANKSRSERRVAESTDKEGELECKWTGMHPRLLSLVCFFFVLFYLYPESLTHTPPGGEAPCQDAFPPQRISRFNLGFVTLKTPFIYLLYRFFFFTWLLATLFPMLFFCLSFFSITPTTPVAAMHGEIQTAIGWSARRPDKTRGVKGLGSPMPGNLPDNGMRPPNNIHKYSDEAKWGCPRDCVAQAVSGMREKEEQQQQ